ncbi:hypothetical protein Bhyg_06490, partial [Pseudolycoriella hygida]
KYAVREVCLCLQLESHLKFLSNKSREMMLDDNKSATASEKTLDESQILTLPNEMIMKILMYVDDCSRMDAAMVCNRFYELICGLDRDKHPLDLCYSDIYDEDIYNSIINSRRIFCELAINFKGCHYLHSSKRIEEIANKFGSRIKKCKLWCSIQAETCKIIDTQVIAILKLMPNVEELILFNIYIISRHHEPRQTELNVQKLRKLELNYCVFDNSNFLDLISANVLTHLVFTFDSLDERIYQPFFNRQGNIRTLEIFENDQITFDHLELEHLKISSNLDFVQMLRQQRKLKYVDFAITWIDDQVFDAVLQLDHLEVFRTLIDQVSCSTFQRLPELKHLKELRIDSHSSYDCGHLLTLSMMKGMNLQKLTLYYAEREIPNEILIQISKNFSKLRHIQLVNRSVQNLVTIVEHFPDMESILMDFFAIFYAPDLLEIFEDGFLHKNLKQIVLTNFNTVDVQNTIPLLKFCNACPNLERIMLSTLTDVTADDLEELLTKHQKLTHLSLEVNSFKFDIDDIGTVLVLISNLCQFRLSRLTTYPAYSTLRCIFKNVFSKITLYKYKTGGAELIMKKGATEDWYSSINIRDHF